MGATLAAMKIGVAFGALGSEIEAVQECCGTIPTASRSDAFDKARQARPCYVDGRLWATEFGPVFPWSAVARPVVLIAALAIFSIIVHTEWLLLEETRQGAWTLAYRVG